MKKEPFEYITFKNYQTSQDIIGKVIYNSFWQTWQSFVDKAYIGSKNTKKEAIKIIEIYISNKFKSTSKNKPTKTAKKNKQHNSDQCLLF